jgi:hypothetical protein
MSRLLLFLVGCAALFAVALGAGRLVGPVAAQPSGAAAHDMRAAGDSSAAGMAGMDHHEVGGLQASAEGYTLTLNTDAPVVGPRVGISPLRFTITGPDGHAVTAYDEQHERDLHLVVVRRDLTGFQHVHPTLDPTAGEWTVDVDLTAGAWRVLADFQPSVGPALVLGADLLVPGEFAPEPLGADRLDARVDDYDVTLGGSFAAGEETVLTATVLRGGVPVTDLQPYLGAFGHLVSLRDGDLGYLHVHPGEDGGPGPAISFHTEFPGAGRYRLFLDFRHGDVVRTAAFTVTVEGGVEGAVEGGAHDH